MVFLLIFLLPNLAINKKESIIHTLYIGKVINVENVHLETCK